MAIIVADFTMVGAGTAAGVPRIGRATIMATGMATMTVIGLVITTIAMTETGHIITDTETAWAHPTDWREGTATKDRRETTTTTIP